MITFQKINADNWEDCIELTLTTEQEQFMASNLYSIAEAQFLPNFDSVGIYYQQEIIGYLLYGIDADDGNFWIYRLMIDQKYQRQGYGKQAIKQLIHILQQENPLKIPFLYLGYHPDNMTAKQFYQSIGFEEVGIADWGEELARYPLNQSTQMNA